jgi:hypothetical protein
MVVAGLSQDIRIYVLGAPLILLPLVVGKKTLFLKAD